MEFVSFRAEKELKMQLELLATMENKNKSDEYREIFLLGMQEKKKEVSVRKYRLGELSLGKASELSGLTNWEFLQLLREKKVPLNLTKEEVLEGVENL
ncbi:MAG: UPF0175 family protein [Candidatus Micrarchaeota archaeon]